VSTRDEQVAELKADVITEGRSAYRSGLRARSNPYPNTTLKHHWWKRGWTEERKERERG